MQIHMKSRPLRCLAAVTVILTLANGCASLWEQPNGQISVRVVSWPLVKKLAEPDAPLPGHKVTVLRAADHTVIAEKSTDISGTAVFALPPGTYTVLGASNQPETVGVQSGQVVNLKLVEH